MWWVYLLVAFGGGIMALAALMAVMLYNFRGSSCLNISRGKSPVIIKEGIVLQEHEMRRGGLYVKIHNGSADTVNMFTFNIKIYDHADKLFAETEEYLRCEPLPPQGISEHVLSPQSHTLKDNAADWLHEPGNRVEVKLLYAYKDEDI